MGAQIIPLMQRRLRPAFPCDWSPQELAEFYRVESALLQAGLQLETERGVTDEGDPWFVFCRRDTGDVFIHFARVDGEYLVDGAAMGRPLRGADFAALVREMIARHPLSDVRRPGSNVFLHPAALLIALVGAAFFQSGKAKAAETAHSGGAASAPAVGGHAGAQGGDARGKAEAPPPAAEARNVALDAGEVAAVLAGVAAGLRLTATAAAVGVETNAAALAFGAAASIPGVAPPPPSPIMPPTAAPLGAGEVRAALLMMAVIKDLAPAPPAPPAAAAGAAGVAASLSVAAPAAPVAEPLDAAAVQAPPALAPTAAAVVWVRLGPGAFPQIEALRVVLADGALLHLGAAQVQHLSELPAALQAILGPALGGGGNAAGEPPSFDARLIPLHTSSDHVRDGAASSVSGSDPSHGAPDVAPSSPAGASTETVTAPSNPPAPESGLPSPAGGPTLTLPGGHTGPTPPHLDVDAALAQFLGQGHDVKMVVTGHDVVFYDPAIMNSVPVYGDSMSSYTFHFADGSSLSLVGWASELHGLHGVG